jgi:chromate transporter
MRVLWQLAVMFGGLSLLAVGSGTAALPEMQRLTVAHGWLTNRDFLDFYALSRIAPGPGSLIVTLIGQRVAGVPGAIAATLAMFGPSCLLVYLAARFWQRFADAPWRTTVERGLAPVGVGLSYAAALALIRGTEHGAAALSLTAVATVVLAVTPLNPLLVLAAGALAGWAIGL